MDKDYNINELKIIDFDVGLFNTIPENILPLPENYEKILNNKKIRGTRIYMLKDKFMSFKNDIYSLGVIALILLYKNIRLIIAVDKKNLCDDNPKNKKIIIKNQNLMKKLNKLRDKIEDNKNKIKILDLIDVFLKKNNSEFFNNNMYKFKFYKEFIINCLSNTFDINGIIDKYDKLLFNE
jgi:serine/threonine protein kinase